jgi:hypothetical protein
MADASQELMLRVRGDNRGADKAINDTANAVKRLHISGEKARGAFSNFSRTLAEARSGADVAAGAADSLSHIIGKSLVGAVAVGSVKIFTDQIEKMGEIARAVAQSASKAFQDIDKAGGAISLAEAQSQVKGLEANISSISETLAELDRSPLKNFIASLTGTRKSIEELQQSQQRLRDLELAAGMMSQNINEERLSGLDEEGRRLEEISQQYRERQKFQESIKDPQAREEFSSASASKFARDRGAELDRQAKKSAEEQIKFDKMVFDAEQKLANQSEAREKKTEQERVQRKIDNNKRIYREERYNLDEKIRMESDADDRKFSRLLRDAVRTRDENKQKKETAREAVGGVLGATSAGRQAMETATKRRERELKIENARTADQLTGTEVDAGSLGKTRVGQQRDREKLAAQQAAANAPSLAEQIQGQRTGVNPAELAATNAAQRFEDQRKPFGMETKGVKAPKEEAFSALLKAIEALSNKLPAAVAVGNK